MSEPEEPFEGQNQQFGGQPPSGPTGNIPPHVTPPPYSTPGYGTQPPYGEQPPYGAPPPYGAQPSHGAQSPYGTPPPYGAQAPYGAPPPGGTSQPYGASGVPPSPYGAPSPWSRSMGPPPPDHLAWAIVTTLLCCLPLGVVSIVYSSRVSSRWAMGDFAGAYEASAKAKQFASWSIAAAGLAIVAYLAFVGIAMISSS